MSRVIRAGVFLVIVSALAFVVLQFRNELARERMIRQLAEFREQLDTFEKFGRTLNLPFREIL